MWLMMESSLIRARQLSRGRHRGPLAQIDATDTVRLRMAYPLVLAREPRADEAGLALEFLGQTDTVDWTALLYSLFASVDFRTLD